MSQLERAASRRFAGCCVLLLGLSLATPTINAVRAEPIYDLWVQSVRVDSLYAAMDASGNPQVVFQSDPLVFTIEVGKCGQATVPAGKLLHFRLNGSDVQTWPLSDDTLQTYQYSVQGTLLTDAVCWIDQGVDEYHDGNNQLTVQIRDRCLCNLTMPDPDGGSDLQLTLFKNAGTSRSGRYPFALLILPPFDRGEAQPEGTMATTLTVNEMAGQTEEVTTGVKAGIGIGAEFSLGPVKIEAGVEIESQWESASGTESERTNSETFSASAAAAEADSNDHRVILADTFYFLCDYDVTSGSKIGQRVVIAVPQDDPVYPNPELTAIPLDHYTTMARYDALWLQSACTVGDPYSYGMSAAPERHLAGNSSIQRAEVVFESGRTVSTAGRNWGVTLSESNYKSQSLSVTMTAKGGFLGLEFTGGAEEGHTHSVIEGSSAGYDFQIGGTQEDTDQYKVVAYMANLLVDHNEAGNARCDRLMVVDYYVPIAPPINGGDDGQNEEDQAAEEATRAVEQAQRAVPDPSGLQEIIAAWLELLTNPDDWYWRFKQAMEAFNNWLEQWLVPDSAYPRAADLDSLVHALVADLDGLLATPTTDPGWRYRASQSLQMLRDVAYLTEVVFCPDPSRANPTVAPAGGEVQVVYEPSKGALPLPVVAPDIGVSWDGVSYVYQSMAEDSTRGVWEAAVSVPGDARRLSYQFRDGGAIDDRMGFGWQLPVSRAGTQDHDNGNFVLSLTSQGIVGTTGGASPAGLGFCYPKTGANRLRVGSLWLGDAAGVASRDYDADPDPEWQSTARAPAGIWRADGDTSQITFAAFTDSAGAQPRGLLVTQGGVSRETSADEDYAIVMYHVLNESESTLSSLYLGLFADFQIGATAGADFGGTDGDLDLAYMHGGSSGVHAGVCALIAGLPGQPPLSANRTLIDLSPYLASPGYVPDADKQGYLSGATGYRLPVAATPSDWGALVSVGPFILEPGEDMLVGFAILGGGSLQELKDNAARARAWWSLYRAPWLTAVELAGEVPARPRLSVAPNPFNPRTEVVVAANATESCELRIYDLQGRAVRTLHRGLVTAGTNRYAWDGRDERGQAVSAGVYVCRLLTGAGASTTKMILVK